MHGGKGKNDTRMDTWFYSFQNILNNLSRALFGTLYFSNRIALYTKLKHPID